MQQGERSDRSRAALLDAALVLFSSQGYRATSVRDIAERASVSTGSVYHHFRDKESIFQTLLDQFRTATGQPDFPLLRVFEDGAFPDDLSAVGAGSQPLGEHGFEFGLEQLAQHGQCVWRGEGTRFGRGNGGCGHVGARSLAGGGGGPGEGDGGQRGVVAIVCPIEGLPRRQETRVRRVRRRGHPLGAQEDGLLKRGHGRAVGRLQR